MYDIIGDIHGYHSKLCELLTKLGYTKNNGSFSHPTRKAIFVGDYIDRGPEIRETMNLVRNIEKEGSAIALMGNHENNALTLSHSSCLAAIKILLFSTYEILQTNCDSLMPADNIGDKSR